MIARRATRGPRRGGRLALATVSLAVRLVAGGLAISRLARAATRVPPLRPMVTPSVTPAGVATHGTCSVVIPARDEAARIGPVLTATVGAPGVEEVIVVDDRSSDTTAAVATAAGARVVAGTDPPAGWAGKAWALQQGIEAATTDWIVTLDADTDPSPRLPGALVARAVVDDLDLVTVGGRFRCPTAGSRWLHAAMLTTLVYRFGPSGGTTTDPERVMANGQCTALRRVPFLAGGGMSAVAGSPVEDVALARHLARRGDRVAFLDASELLTVQMFKTFADTWSGWGRSIALPGVEARRRQLVDLAVVAIAQAWPLPRLLRGRGDLVDLALVALRLGTLVGTARAYERTDAAYWASPLADVPATVALGLGVFRRRQVWRGRTYVT